MSCFVSQKGGPTRAIQEFIENILVYLYFALTGWISSTGENKDTLTLPNKKQIDPK